LTYLACVGALDPELEQLHRSSEDLAWLQGRKGQVALTDLFDHARRGRLDTVFFGAAEVDGRGRTNLSAIGSLASPKVKLPGLAGASSLRRWSKRPIIVVPRQSRRNLVKEVQVASTRDDARPTLLLTDLASFHLAAGGATLVSRAPHASLELVRERTGFEFEFSAPSDVEVPPAEGELLAIRRIDSTGLRDELVS
jgi:glutaconate CoA-transferase subunit B